MEALAFSLRPFTEGDTEACLAVHASNIPEFCTDAEVPQFRRFLARTRECRVRYLVGERDGRVVACGGLAIDRERGVATFCWGLIERGLHRRGLGTRLTLERLSWIVDDPAITRVELDTSHRTRAFYARFGFDDVRVVPDGYAPGLHRHDMALTLDDARRAALRALTGASSS